MINIDLATNVFLEYFLNNFEEQIWVCSSFFSYTQYFSLLIPEVQPVLNMVIPLHTRGRRAQKLVELIIIEQKHALVKKKSAPIPKQTNNLAEG